jgi:hypothetical protein
VPSTEAVPSTEGDEDRASPPSIPPPTSGTELATEEARVGPVAASEGFEAEAITTEPAFISEIEGVIAAADQGEAEPVIAGTTSAMEAVPFEVRDFLEVPNEPKLPDSRVPLPEGIEPLSAGVSSSAGIIAPEVRHHSEVQSEPEVPGPGIEEVTSAAVPHGGRWSVPKKILSLASDIKSRYVAMLLLFALVSLKFGSPVDFVCFLFFFFFCRVP